MIVDEQRPGEGFAQDGFNRLQNPLAQIARLFPINERGLHARPQLVNPFLVKGSECMCRQKFRP